MLRPFRMVLLLAGLAAPAIYADVALLYKTSVKINPALPPEIGGSISEAQARGPAAVAIRVKGARFHCDMKRFAMIMDADSSQITLLDPVAKRIATVPAAEYMEKAAAAMPQIPEQARKALEKMKIGVQSSRTGRSETILGVDAEERQMVVTVDGPMGRMTRLEFRLWSARPEETLRVPAIRELTGFQLWGAYVMSASGGMQSALAQAPGIGEGIARLMEETGKSVMLRVEIRAYLPTLAALVQKLSKDGRLPPGFDPEAPFMEWIQEAVELSTAPLDAALFRTPADYRRAPAEELLGSMMRPPSVSP